MREEVQETARVELARMVQTAYRAGESTAQQSDPEFAWIVQKLSDPRAKHKDDEDLGWQLQRRVREVLHYAILSHRWFAKGEPTFQDLRTYVQDAE